MCAWECSDIQEMLSQRVWYGHRSRTLSQSFMLIKATGWVKIESKGRNYQHSLAMNCAVKFHSTGNQCSKGIEERVQYRVIKFEDTKGHQSTGGICPV